MGHKAVYRHLQSELKRIEEDGEGGTVERPVMRDRKSPPLLLICSYFYHWQEP